MGLLYAIKNRGSESLGNFCLVFSRRVYHFKGKKMEPIVIEKGLADLSNVEIKSGLNEGDSVILEAKAKGPRR